MKGAYTVTINSGHRVPLSPAALHHIISLALYFAFGVLRMPLQDGLQTQGLEDLCLLVCLVLTAEKASCSKEASSGPGMQSSSTDSTGRVGDGVGHGCLAGLHGS